MNRLSKKQRQIIEYIIGYQKKWNCQPTIIEISAAVNITPQGAAGRINRMIRHGYLTRKGYRFLIFEDLLEKEMKEKNALQI